MGLEIGQNALWEALSSLGTFRIHGYDIRLNRRLDHMGI